MKDIESRIDELSESACALDQAEVLQFGEFVFLLTRRLILRFGYDNSNKILDKYGLFSDGAWSRSIDLPQLMVHPGISWVSPRFHNTLKGNDQQFLAKSPKTQGFSTQGNSLVPVDPR
jgi:hypothetical protein